MRSDVCNGHVCAAHVAVQAAADGGAAGVVVAIADRDRVQRAAWLAEEEILSLGVIAHDTGSAHGQPSPICPSDCRELAGLGLVNGSLLM